MNRFPPASLVRSRTGFTLIELLVVVAIIGVLAAILLPVYGKVIFASQKVKAINDMRNIKVAMLSFQGDYQKYPVMPAQTTYQIDTLFGDVGGYYASADLFDILRAIDIGPAHCNQNNAINTSQTVYWTGQNAASLTQPRSGISQADIQGVNAQGAAKTIPKGSFMDPWGRPYIVYIDITKDGDLTDAAGWYYYNAGYKAGDVHTGLFPNGLEFVSMGPDGVYGTKSAQNPNGNGILAGSDDIVTWPH